MDQLRPRVWSSVGKKIISAATGLGLVVFITVHLLGNLLLLKGNPDAFNRYAHFLESFGWVLYIIEAGLLLFFLFHITLGITVWWDKKKARSQGYVKTTKAGPPSHLTFSSKNMIITGLLVLLFLIVHLATLEYGPGIDQGYKTVVNGVEMRDLYRLVSEVFGHLEYVVGYIIIMIVLGFHLRHGFWSSFQSLGVNHPRLTPLICTFGVIFAIVVAVGFLILPIVIYLRGGGV